MFAAAPRHGFLGGEIHFRRGEGGAFVRAVAERLAFGLAAGAEVIRADFHRQDKRGFLGDDRFIHAPKLFHWRRKAITAARGQWHILKMSREGREVGQGCKAFSFAFFAAFARLRLIKFKSFQYPRACRAAARGLVSRREETRPPRHPAQDHLPALDLHALPGAAAREQHRHGFQRGARQGRRRQAHAAPQRPRLLRHLRHARAGLRRGGIIRENFRRTRHVQFATGHSRRRGASRPRADFLARVCEGRL